MTFREFASLTIVTFYVSSDWVLDCSSGYNYNDRSLSIAAEEWNKKHNYVFDADLSTTPSTFEVNESFIEFLDSLQLDTDFEIVNSNTSDDLKELELVIEKNLELTKQIAVLQAKLDMASENQYYAKKDSDVKQSEIVVKPIKSLF